MRERLEQYWAKADPVLGGHHPVLLHSLDVAACAAVLLRENSPLCERFARSTGLSTDAVVPTIASVVALHDIGKIDTRFQRKAPAVANRLRPHTAQLACGPYDHGTEGFRQLEARPTERHLWARTLGERAFPLIRAVCGHHGVLPSRDEPAPYPYPRSIRGEDEAARAAFLTTIADFFAQVGARLPWTGIVSGPLVQQLAGLCTVADWLGSNVEFFPYRADVPEPAEYWQAALTSASNATRAAGLTRVGPGAGGFATLFPGFTPRDVQTLMDRVPADRPSLTLIEAEMGKGKTEASLALASRFLAAGLGDGVTVCLPTMATSNAMFARVRDVAERLFSTGEVQLALAHGRAARHPLLRSIVRAGLRQRDADAAEASVACARWLLNRKRVLLAQLGVGTIDQALQAALTIRHQFVRMFGLSRNVLIVDEVHAYDAYMNVLLELLLEWMGALRVPVVLLSATLPSVRRSELVAAWRRGAGQYDEVALAPLADAVRDPYPLVTVATERETQSLHVDETGPVKTLQLEILEHRSDDGEATDSVADRLARAAAAGARVVWIRNTVREAQAAWHAVAARAGETEKCLFHARFRACDRSVIERTVLSRFGRDAPAGGRVLVATQVVEQSLDLDFDELHTDLAPVDLMLQRAGRLHRHERAAARHRRASCSLKILRPAIRARPPELSEGARPDGLRHPGVADGSQCIEAGGGGKPGNVAGQTLCGACLNYCTSHGFWPASIPTMKGRVPCPGA
ncbi:MAG: CRISPR-associated helicase Cas3' [Myxococcota bacterium]